MASIRQKQTNKKQRTGKWWMDAQRIIYNETVRYTTISSDILCCWAINYCLVCWGGVIPKLSGSMTFLEHLLEWTRIKIRSYEKKNPPHEITFGLTKLTFVPTNKNSFQRNEILSYEEKNPPHEIIFGLTK